MNIKHSKEDIIKTGMNLFRLKGYHHTGTKEIIGEAGISRGSFYNFFKDKDDFGVQVLDYYTKWTSDYLEELLSDTDKSPMQRIIHLFTEFVNTYKEVNYKWGCLLVGMTQELAGINEVFTKASRKNFETLIDPLSDCIEEGQKKGEILNLWTPRQLAMNVLAGYNGSLILMKSGLNSEPLDAFLAQLEHSLKS
ncbi:TetR/AcrR family transcriptional regulator [Aquimarina sp. 2304DJ70-9]|uniref:TetR/AcrR family transcriptional regulator n=1 Tax=Aquimarina penaris TaxID=3231044 RepID=UPI0034626B98